MRALMANNFAIYECCIHTWVEKSYIDYSWDEFFYFSFLFAQRSECIAVNTTYFLDQYKIFSIMNKYK